MTTKGKAKAGGVEPWDVEWAAELAGDALAYLARHYPECAASEVLREHEEVANEAAMDGDEVSTAKLSALTVGPGETRR